MSTTGWETSPGEFPWPPPNVQVVSPLFTGAIDIRWDDPSLLNTGYKADPTQATGTITVTGTPDPGVKSSGTILVNAVPVAAGTVLTVGGNTLTAGAGARTSGANDFDGSLGTVDLLAAELVAALNDAANAFSALIDASVLADTVTLTAVTAGVWGDGITLSTSSGVLFTLSGLALAGGQDADTITVGVYTLTAVTGTVTSGSNEFSVDGSTSVIAGSIASNLNNPNNSFTSTVSALAASNVVTLTANSDYYLGVQGNTIALSTTASALTVSDTTLTGGTGTEVCVGKNNTQWSIVGVNIYRSESGERGPYRRLNKFPIGSFFFRDYTDNVLIEEELVQWDGAWLAQGDSPNDRRFKFRTQYYPIVKASGQAISANAPSDVSVKIDGQTVPVEDVFGPRGEITLINQRVWDISRETWIEPLLPTETSEVLVTYRYNRNVVKTDLDKNSKVFYRVVTVAVDSSTPSGLVETPLGYSQPVSLMQVETFDYIWLEAIRRNLWILQQGGERVKLFLRKHSGVTCWCRGDKRLMEYQQQPDSRCTTCYGTGFVGGYDGPIDIIIGPDEADRRISQTPEGRRMEHQYEVWVGPSPVVGQRDFIVKQTGERYSIGPVRRPAVRGLPLQQHFTIAYLDEQDLKYQVPLTGLTELTWPQTRTTDQDTQCDPNEPYPEGFDYQATPMESEKDNIPDEREKRGRTPVWENIQF